MSDPALAHPDAVPLLALRDVTLAFGPKVIQHDLSMDVQRGSIFAVMGPQRLRQEHGAEIHDRPAAPPHRHVPR